MPYWRFEDYITEAYANPFDGWYGQLDDELKAALDLFLTLLSETADWDELKPRKRKYRILDQKHAGLCELKLKLGNRKLRPVGILLRDEQRFILFGGCEENGRFTIPPNAFDEALLLKGAYDKGRGTTREHL
jgi:hypothetical protein